MKILILLICGFLANTAYSFELEQPNSQKELQLSNGKVAPGRQALFGAKVSVSSNTAECNDSASNYNSYYNIFSKKCEKGNQILVPVLSDVLAKTEPISQNSYSQTHAYFRCQSGVTLMDCHSAMMMHQNKDVEYAWEEKYYTISE